MTQTPSGRGRNLNALIRRLARFGGTVAGAVAGAVSAADRVAASAVDRACASAAEAIVLDLQEEGPQWSGHFANSWVIAAGDVDIQPSTPSPRAPQAIRRISARLTTGRNVARGGIRYTIGNEAAYRDIAMDFEPGQFRNPGFEPIKENVPAGRKVDEQGFGIRGGGGGDQGSKTADRDWYTRYLNGGELDQRFRFVVDDVLAREWSADVSGL